MTLTVRVTDWISVARLLPEEQQIVFVFGGLAQFRDGKFYTCMEDPRDQREIQWPVLFWQPMVPVWGVAK